MATSDQRNKWKCEELAAALSGSKKLSALGFVINPNKRTRQRLSQASKHRMIQLLYHIQASQQVNPVNPPISDVGIITVSNSRNKLHKLTNPTSIEVSDRKSVV